MTAATAPGSPDLAEAARFLTLLAEDEAVTFQTFGDAARCRARPAIRHGTLEQHAAALAADNRAGAGVYVMVNAGDGQGRRRENVTAVRALFVDLDGAPLEPVQRAGLQPHAIIESSPGRWHAYWLVRDCELAAFEGWQKALAARFAGDAKVCDLPRVMRLPGFYHCKAAPFRSRLLEHRPALPYRVAELVRGLGLRRAEAPRATPGDDRAAGGTTVPPVIEGGRNSFLVKQAGRLRRLALAPRAIEQALLAENAAHCRPPLPDAEVRRIAASIGRYPAGEAVRPDGWSEPLLPGAVSTPPIAAALLPDYLGAMAQAVAASTQTAEASATLLLLPMLAAAVQRRFVVAPYGDADYTEPVNVWALVALVSGARKTPILSALSEPLRAWEKLRRDALRGEIARRQAAIAVAKKRIEKLQIDASRADDGTARRRLENEIKQELELMPEELRAPRLLTGDVTPERLQQLLAEQGERIALVSDEAGIFSVMAGLYSGGAMHLDAFLQAWSGSAVRVDRSGRLAHLDRPALTFALALQPGVLADVANVKRFHDSGLLGRFLYALPASTVGMRDVRVRNPIPSDVRASWERNLYALLDGADAAPTAPRMLPFEAAARDRWLDFAQAVEHELRDGGRLENVREWGAKLAGQVGRIAGLLTLGVEGLGARAIGLDAADRAVRLGELLIPHAQAAFRLMGADTTEADAVHLLRWIRAVGLYEFDRAHAHKALEGRFRSVDRLKSAAARLAEWHVLSEERHRSNPGARPTPYYAVNPRLFDSSMAA